MGKEFSDKHDSSRVNTLSTFCSAFNIIYIMRTIIAKRRKAAPKRESVIQPATSPGRRNEHTYRELRHLQIKQIL